MRSFIASVEFSSCTPVLSPPFCCTLPPTTKFQTAQNHDPYDTTEVECWRHAQQNHARNRIPSYKHTYGGTEKERMTATEKETKQKRGTLY
mmetsp:Transcript_47940/g.94580  ORF Transcript_47940/g.94580 Transcript_47940/m.94580 type:complete len:91 (-) Transcript_47940:277-549(-)